MSQIGAQSTHQPSETVRAEAAAWIARMHGPTRSPELEAGLRRWLAENPDHARVFERMTEAWQAATHVAAAQSYRVRIGKRSFAPRQWAWAAVALIVCGILGPFLYMEWSDPAYVTKIGEQRMVRLDDGSRVALNSGSRMVVEYRRSQRRVRLDRGEAFFEVEHNAQRPFVVFAGDQQVAALGTSFGVRYEHKQLAVVLVEGKVAVSGLPPPVPDVRINNAAGAGNGSAAVFTEDGSPGASVITLVPGQRLVLAASEPVKLDTPKMETVIAWRHGEVIFEKTRIADAVAELNRYDEAKLVVPDAQVANLLVSGIYRSGDSEKFARAMAQLYGLTVTDEDGRIYLSKDRRPPS